MHEQRSVLLASVFIHFFEMRPTQLDGQKNMLEIEINEGLHRRHRELQSKLETLGEADDDRGSSGQTLEARLRELKSLNASMAGTTKRAHGVPTFESMLICSDCP